MNEINKLRARLVNVLPNVTEYRMSVSEAKGLLKEINELQKLKPPEAVLVESGPAIIDRVIIDGGEF